MTNSLLFSNKEGVTEAVVPIKILLVDDKKENLFSLEQFLSDDDYKPQFIKCTSGNEALSIALKEELALILLDVQMPGMDGYEVARFLKENKKTRAIPIVFVTALDHEVNYILEGYKKGAVDYLFKPLNPSITRAKVKAFIQLYQQQKELEQKNQMLQNLVMLINNSIDLMCILEEETLRVQNINSSWHNSLKMNQKEILNLPIGNLPFEKDSFEILNHTFKNILVFENCYQGSNGEKKWYSWSFVKDQTRWFGNGKEITKNKLFEKELKAANDHLELKVIERTSDLQEVNDLLKSEIEKRYKVEDDLRKNNERLAKANEELDSFVYAASHDLKSPMANIELMVSILKRKLQGKVSDEEKKLFEMMGQSVEKFNTILHDLSQIISIEKDIEDEYEEIDFREIFDNVLEDVRELAEKSRVEINASFGVTTVKNSRKNIRSILYNLISNGIKYRSSKRLPKVEVTTSEQGEYIVLSVRDNGLGLNNNQKERMFGMFRRFHPHIEGSGIGLFLLKKIVENSGGKIVVESKEGEGSVFSVFLKKI